MLRRVVCGAALTTLVGVTGAGMAQAASDTTSGQSQTPPAVRGEHFTNYCVNNYQPNSQVTVTNTSNGYTHTITTNIQGHGCTTIQVDPGHCDTITAHGNNVSGTGTTHSSSTVCVKAVAASNQGSTLPFTGSNDVIPMSVIGGVLVLLGGGLVVVARRRREDGPIAA